MKKILIIAVLGLLLSSCKKEVELAPSINYKVGIIYDADLGEKTLSIELTSSFGEIQDIHFQSEWAFLVDGKKVKISLSEGDFSWQPQGRTWRGKMKKNLGEFLSSPKITHRSTTICGEIKLDGKWYPI